MSLPFEFTGLSQANGAAKTKPCQEQTATTVLLVLSFQGPCTDLARTVHRYGAVADWMLIFNILLIRPNLMKGLRHLQTVNERISICMLM